MENQNPYRSSAMFLWLSAALSAIGPVLGAPLGYIIVALVMGVLAMGLVRGMRWIAYIAFLVAGISGAIVLGWIWSIGGPPTWWAIITTATCWLTASMLFGALWRPNENTTST